MIYIQFFVGYCNNNLVSFHKCIKQLFINIDVVWYPQISKCCIVNSHLCRFVSYLSHITFLTIFSFFALLILMLFYLHIIYSLMRFCENIDLSVYQWKNCVFVYIFRDEMFDEWYTFMFSLDTRFIPSCSYNVW